MEPEYAKLQENNSPYIKQQQNEQGNPYDAAGNPYNQGFGENQNGPPPESQKYEGQDAQMAYNNDA